MTAGVVRAAPEEKPRITPHLLRVVRLLLDAFEAGEEMHGWAIKKATGLSGPTVYNNIDRLMTLGWVTDRWVDPPPGSDRPRKRLYQLTESGAARARNTLAERDAATRRDLGRWNPTIGPPR